ncbi:TPA_asm: hypothetical protein G3375_004679 [Salmonella enterica subsp. enterica serovar Heidelberg]|nr:hypothetical protein [Salmonella enterica subsp. enterica serovar Heidelberg]
MCIYLNLMILIKIIRGFIRAWHQWTDTPSIKGRVHGRSRHITNHNRRAQNNISQCKG